MRIVSGLLCFALLIGCSSKTTIVDDRTVKTDSSSVKENTITGTHTHQPKADSVKIGEIKKDEPVKKEVIDLAALRQQGLELYTAEKYEEAYPIWLKIAENANGQNEILTEAHYVLGNLFFHKAEYVKAEIELKQAIQGRPDFVDAHQDLGLVFFVKGDYDKALKSFTRVLEILPGDSEATYWVNYTHGSKAFEEGLENFNLNWFDKSIEQFKAALTYLGNDTSVNYKLYYFLGKAYSEKLEYDQALTALNQCITIKPNLPEAYTEVGTIHLARRDFNKAIALNERSIKADPNYAKAYNNLGYIYFTMANNFAVNKDKNQADEYYKKSVVLFEKALGFDPDMAGAQVNMDHVKKILSGERNVAAYTMLQQAVKNENNAEKIRQYQRIIAEDPTYDDAYNNLAVAYFYEGKVDSALSVLEKAIEINPYNPQAHNNIGYMLGTAHKFEDALRHLFIAIQIKRDYLDAYVNLGYVYMWKQDFVSARKIWLQLLKIDPNNKEARKGFSELEKREQMAKAGETNTVIEVHDDASDSDSNKN